MCKMSIENVKKFHIEQSVHNLLAVTQEIQVRVRQTDVLEWNVFEYFTGMNNRYNNHVLSTQRLSRIL